ncbi:MULTISPECIES: alpha/beta fold hydrolase [Vibrio]|uniref:Alpha/beta fold hydrolase n=1 Tax=Vibrio algicola TaxID=2662262 RepID=A0A5Q0TCZ2_9VIBR|nr:MULTISPECIES: alpha/beta fold hydrolase [Vibrio]MBD1576440.1 alpha/beta fold hydrolase [Vibrio sp. S11_S32]
MELPSGQAPSFSQEENLLAFSISTLTPFWNTKKEGYIEGQEGKKLYWVSLTHPENTKAIVVVNGRIESVCKYQELFYDLSQQGYDIYSYDHRGQGLSDRSSPDRHLGHVEKFDHYIKDLHHILRHFDLDENYQEKFLIAHSMGGAISTRYLQTHPNHGFKRVVLSAPMVGIHMPWYLRSLAVPLSKWMASRNPIGYLPGKKGYHVSPFSANDLTHSPIRYQWFRDLYEQQPDIQLGGPSRHWVNQSLNTTRLCHQQADKINVPLLLLQASEDIVVDNTAQNKFVNKINKHHENLATLVEMKGSKHEVFFEIDSLRNQALNETLTFLKG